MIYASSQSPNNGRSFFSDFVTFWGLTNTITTRNGFFSGDTAKTNTVTRIRVFVLFRPNAPKPFQRWHGSSDTSDPLVRLFRGLSSPLSLYFGHFRTSHVRSQTSTNSRWCKLLLTRFILSASPSNVSLQKQAHSPLCSFNSIYCYRKAKKRHRRIWLTHDSGLIQHC